MRGALHFLLRVGPHFYLSRRAPHPRRCCSAHARLATAQGCHALGTPPFRSRIRARSSRRCCARAYLEQNVVDRCREYLPLRPVPSLLAVLPLLSIRPFPRHVSFPLLPPLPFP